MDNKLVILLIASICTLTHVARAEAGEAVVPDGTWATYWTAQYPWCMTGAYTAGAVPGGADLFVCRRNVRIVPIEGAGSNGLVQLGLLWKERTAAAANQVRLGTGNSETTR